MQYEKSRHRINGRATNYFYTIKVKRYFSLKIIVQVGLKVQVGKISKINKSAGWNKAIQVGILGNLLLQIMVFAYKSQDLIKVQVGIRACRLENF